ncbi:hypothetical protein T281_08185 [Rhodomicrobium udaipurense JA643]|uniref:CorA-like Mg2+ transporter protein n=1 Tax=Rhodomicrobium udaipurense TaxID=1202716 RepID=A0A8I1GBB6_9HYPH|nr:CorA family divalent cation transporter [Rhodomicrobium udaipurense]KAI94943.1 hypothetical protein T281_08185 [Rhodomicrobium udaipurense JA643]MBJ7542610.1 hypothetical protein [Rhodomicrobium udaipurense]
MQEKVMLPQEAKTQAPGRIAHHFREIVLWPLQIITSGEKSGFGGCGALFDLECEGTPWRSAGPFGGDHFEERHYREFISFLPHAQRFLYGDAPDAGRKNPGDLPMKVYRRSDIKKVRITTERGATPVICDVSHIDLYFFYEVNTAILVCEIGAENIPLEIAQGITQTFGRAYPAGWTKDGQPVHCAARVEWLDDNDAVLCASDYEDRERYIDFVGTRRSPCIARHWEFVLSPIVNAASSDTGRLRFREIEYYRMPVMTYITLPSLDVLTKRDYIALTLATRPSKTGIMPYSKRFVQKFEANHVYDRMYSGGLDAPELETRFLTSGEAFAIVSAGDNPSLTDDQRGLLSQFRHQYFRLFLVAHFHKASLLMISDQLVATLKRLDPSKPDSRMAFRDETLLLQENFLRFSQRYFFTELSGRAHVRDLFRMLRKHLAIDALFAEVRSELFDLVKYLDSNALRKQNASMHRLTVVTTVGLIGTIVTGFLGMNLIAYAEEPMSFRVEYFIAVLVAVTIFVGLTIIYSRRLTDLFDKLSGENQRDREEPPF